MMYLLPQDTMVIGRAGKVLRLIRVMRILRVFNVTRSYLVILKTVSLQLLSHFTGLQSLLSTMQQAYQELGLLMVLLWVIVITISRCSKLNSYTI